MKPWTTGVRRGAPRSALFGVVVQFETKATRHIWKLLRAHSARIDPNCIEAAKYFPNAEFIAGRSQEKLPGALRTIEERGLKLEFVLIDGDHGEDGVRGDIDCILKYKPKTPCYILMHDSFNPFCREGMLSAAWEQCPYVHKVDIDFIPGKFYPPGETFQGKPIGDEMWSGMGLAMMRPETRVGPLKIFAGSQHLFNLSLRHSVHHRVVLAKHWLGPELYQRLKRTLGPRRILPDRAIDHRTPRPDTGPLTVTCTRVARAAANYLGDARYLAVTTATVSPMRTHKWDITAAELFQNHRSHTDYQLPPQRE